MEKNWCRLQGSNPRPPDYKSGALPTELSRPWKFKSRRAAILGAHCAAALFRRPADPCRRGLSRSRNSSSVSPAGNFCPSSGGESDFSVRSSQMAVPGFSRASICGSRPQPGDPFGLRGGAGFVREHARARCVAHARLADGLRHRRCRLSSADRANGVRPIRWAGSRDTPSSPRTRGFRPRAAPTYSRCHSSVCRARAASSLVAKGPTVTQLPLPDATGWASRASCSRGASTLGDTGSCGLLGRKPLRPREEREVG